MAVIVYVCLCVCVCVWYDSDGRYSDEEVYRIGIWGLSFWGLGTEFGDAEIKSKES
jgi:hypothetical protein